jgi:hypothetical protein
VIALRLRGSSHGSIWLRKRQDASESLAREAATKERVGNHHHDEGGCFRQGQGGFREGPDRPQERGRDRRAYRLPMQFVVKAEAQSLIPDEYGDPRTTTLTAEVKEQSNTIDFPLSDADAPSEPKAPAKGGGRRGR